MTRFIYFADSEISNVDEGQTIKIAIERSGPDLEYRDYVRYELDNVYDYRPETTAYASEYPGEGDISYVEEVDWQGPQVIFEPGETIKYATIQANSDFDQEETEFAELYLKRDEYNDSEVWDPEYYVNGGKWVSDWDFEFEFGEPRSKVIAIKDLPYQNRTSNFKADNSAPPASNASNEAFTEILDLSSSSADNSDSGTTIVNNFYNTNSTNTTNNTNNNITTNINNAGNGNVSVGDIGTTNNTTIINNTFQLQTINVRISTAITGDSKKSEKVEGTSGDDLIADGSGKDKLIGGNGADQFYFSGDEPFKKKLVDKVIDFDSDEGDTVVIAEEALNSNQKSPTLAIADTKKDLKSLSKEGYDLLYLEPKGDLYVDGNGESKGYGSKAIGGMIADLPKNTELTESDILIGS